MMEAIRSYLTAVVAVSMIAVLASALAHGSRMERVVRFAAGPDAAGHAPRPRPGEHGADH